MEKNIINIGDSVTFNWYVKNSRETIEGFIIKKRKTKNPGNRCIIKQNMIPEIIWDDFENINKTTLLYTIKSLNDCIYENIKADCVQPASILLLEFLI